MTGQEQTQPYMPKPVDNIYKTNPTGNEPKLNKLDGLKDLMGDVDKLLHKENIADEYKQQGGQ